MHTWVQCSDQTKVKQQRSVKHKERLMQGGWDGLTAAQGSTDKESWAAMWDSEQRAVCGLRLWPHTGQDEWRIKAGLQRSQEEGEMHY